MFLQICSRQQTEPHRQLQGVRSAYHELSGERVLKSSRRKSSYSIEKPRSWFKIRKEHNLSRSLCVCVCVCVCVCTEMAHIRNLCLSWKICWLPAQIVFTLWDRRFVKSILKTVGVKRSFCITANFYSYIRATRKNKDQMKQWLYLNSSNNLPLNYIWYRRFAERKREMWN
jgi:hypothetical protein